MFNSFPIPRPDRGGGNQISYQSGIIAWNDSTTVKDIPISPVSTTLSGTVTLVKVSITATGNPPGSVLATPSLLNATTLRLTRSLGTVISSNFMFWEVIEFQNVKSKQTGNVALNNSTPTSIAISSVNPQKTMAYMVFRNAAPSGSDVTQFLFGYRLQDATTISALAYAGGITGDWQVIEFI